MRKAAKWCRWCVVDRKRRGAAWDAAFAELDKGSEVSPEKHQALLRPGLFKGLSDGEATEEAINVVRYWLCGRDLSSIAARGSVEADNWFTMRAKWGEERQAEKLRNMIKASAVNPDYWEALKLIAVRLLGTGQVFPDDLADWAIAFFKDELEPPPKHRGDRGRPYYTHHNRNYAIAEVFGLLGYLGLDKKMFRYGVLTARFGVDERTVMNAINSATKLDGKLPLPWECWPPLPDASI